MTTKYDGAIQGPTVVFTEKGAEIDGQLIPASSLLDAAEQWTKLAEERDWSLRDLAGHEISPVNLDRYELKVTLTDTSPSSEVQKIRPVMGFTWFFPEADLSAEHVEKMGSRLVRALKNTVAAGRFWQDAP